MSQFFDMGGYGAYIWPCYALTLIVLVGIGVSARRALQVNQESQQGQSGVTT
jgi:heme exporter protein CcmD